MTPTTQRKILIAVSRAPMTAREVAAAVGIDERNAANLCSLMAGSGLLDEQPNERGGRRGRRYSAAVSVHPRDAKVVAEMVADYGPDVVLAMVAKAKGEATA